METKTTTWTKAVCVCLCFVLRVPSSSIYRIHALFIDVQCIMIRQLFFFFSFVCFTFVVCLFFFFYPTIIIESLNLVIMILRFILCSIFSINYIIFYATIFRDFAFNIVFFFKPIDMWTKKNNFYRLQVMIFYFNLIVYFYQLIFAVWKFSAELQLEL